mmetsp:Transcript_8417/g.24061  ORF Transcript_8417/g.24061 Transcript_8417/m.24061 type:complete len:201 (+) Transcript_8417:2189-2791(+)
MIPVATAPAPATAAVRLTGVHAFAHLGVPEGLSDGARRQTAVETTNRGELLGRRALGRLAVTRQAASPPISREGRLARVKRRLPRVIVGRVPVVPRSARCSKELLRLPDDRNWRLPPAAAPARRPTAHGVHVLTRQYAARRHDCLHVDGTAPRPRAKRRPSKTMAAERRERRSRQRPRLRRMDEALPPQEERRHPEKPTT